MVQSRAHTVIGARCAGAGGACGVVLEGGTLTSSAGPWWPLLVPPWWVGNVVGVGGVVVGALLGPEGTGRPYVSVLRGGVAGCLAGLTCSRTVWVAVASWGLAGAWGGCLVVG